MKLRDPDRYTLSYGRVVLSVSNLFLVIKGEVTRRRFSRITSPMETGPDEDSTRKVPKETVSTPVKIPLLKGYFSKLGIFMGI